MIPRYKQARERAGLSQAQATKLAGFDVAAIESSISAWPEQQKILAALYEVTTCWLAGHLPRPDLTDLQRQAEDKDVSFEDWHEIVQFAQSRATCEDCTKERSDG